MASNANNELKYPLCSSEEQTVYIVAKRPAVWLIHPSRKKSKEKSRDSSAREDKQKSSAES